MTTRSVITIEMASGDSQSDWFALNSSYGDNNARGYHVEVASGDSITLDFTLDKDPNNQTVTSFTTSPSYTSNEGGVYDGGWRWVRVNKTGTTGTATVKVES